MKYNISRCFMLELRMCLNKTSKLLQQHTSYINIRAPYMSNTNVKYTYSNLDKAPMPV